MGLCLHSRSAQSEPSFLQTGLITPLLCYPPFSKAPVIGSCCLLQPLPRHSPVKRHVSLSHRELLSFPCQCYVLCHLRASAHAAPFTENTLAAPCKPGTPLRGLQASARPLSRARSARPSQAARASSSCALAAPALSLVSPHHCSAPALFVCLSLRQARSGRQDLTCPFHTLSSVSSTDRW